MLRTRETILFVLASLLLSFAMFGDAMLGRSITAPVDLAPTLWERYQFVDPASGVIPKNHTIVDQLSYDLPLQWTIYHSYRNGEIPWWDPYTYCGRPLLADSHVNGMDPVRVLIYLTVPDFVLAYNWTLVAHHLVLALGLFFLLRHFGASPAVAGGLALAGQVAGGFTLYIGHPWVTAAFSWYPWLWWAWSAWWMRSGRFGAPLAMILAALIFYSGNLQSHVYLPFFALCVVVGCGGRKVRDWLRATGMVACTGIVGALLAAPALGPTLELYLQNERGIQDFPNYMDGLLILSAVWPWSLGTFRTISIESMGFYLYAGPLIFIFAAYGLRARDGEAPVQSAARRVAICILVALIISLCTPLFDLLYRRICGMGVIALLVLAASGAGRIVALDKARQRRLGIVLAGFAVLVVLGTLAAVYVVYPKFRGRMESMLVERGKGDHYEGRSEPLRRFQAANYPNEVGFRNPEVVVALCALVLMAASAMTGKMPAMLAMLLAANVVSPALFARRFVPREPLASWERLRDGGEEQLAVARQVGTGRLLEVPREGHAVFSVVFPLATVHWTRTHVVHGYAALQPGSQTQHPDPDRSRLADWEYTIPAPREAGKWAKLNAAGTARLQWVGDTARPVRISSETLNSMTLSFPPGGAGELLRTDTFFPGWVAVASNGQACAVRRQGVMSVISIPAGADSLVLRYSPAWLGACMVALAAGAVLLLVCLFKFKVTAGNLQLPSRPAE